MTTTTSVSGGAATALAFLRDRVQANDDLLKDFGSKDLAGKVQTQKEVSENGADISSVSKLFAKIGQITQSAQQNA